MKVDDVNSDLIDYSKKLSNRLRDETNRKENDLNNMKENYARKNEDVKNEGKEKYINTLSENDGLLVLAATDYEKKLNNYKNNLNKTKESVEESEASLKNNLKQKTEELASENNLITREKIENAKTDQMDIGNQMKNNLKIISNKAMTQRRNTESEAKIQADTLSSEFDARNITEQNNFRLKLDNDLRLHNEEVNLQQKNLKTLSLKQSEKSKHIIAEKTIVQTEELNFLNKHQKDILLQKQNDFKIRYQKLVKEHDDILASLKTHFDLDVKKMVEQTASKKKTVNDKAEDPFYSVKTLSPKITNDKNEVMVSLKVSEHEKENVHLSVQGRGIKMTLTRKFTDGFKDEDGMINHSTKNELFSKEFPSIDLLNPKLVDQKYENGVLTYRIQKL